MRITVEVEDGVIARDPVVHSGDLVFSGTRIPVRRLADYVLDNQRLADLLEDFPTVRSDQVERLLEALAVAQAAHEDRATRLLAWTAAIVDLIPIESWTRDATVRTVLECAEQYCVESYGTRSWDELLRHLVDENGGFPGTADEVRALFRDG